MVTYIFDLKYHALYFMKYRCYVDPIIFKVFRVISKLNHGH